LKKLIQLLEAGEVFPSVSAELLALKARQTVLEASGNTSPAFQSSILFKSKYL